MKSFIVSYQCSISVTLVWLIRGLYVLPFILLTLLYSLFSQVQTNSGMQQANNNKVHELHLLRQSLLATKQNLPVQSGGFASDSAHTLKALSLPVGEGLSSIEFAPVSSTKLKSVLMEGSEMLIEYELQTLAASVLATEALNGHPDHSIWKLDSIGTAETVGTSQTKYVGKWRRSLTTSR